LPLPRVLDKVTHTPSRRRMRSRELLRVTDELSAINFCFNCEWL
jgi:hypothetical protein